MEATTWDKTLTKTAILAAVAGPICVLVFLWTLADQWWRAESAKDLLSSTLYALKSYASSQTVFRMIEIAQARVEVTSCRIRSPDLNFGVSGACWPHLGVLFAKPD
jgi:hypothetical protein